MAMAGASPPPMHSEATPRLNFFDFSACTSVVMILAPLAPIGWPNAQAPPCTLTCACSSPTSRIAAIVTTAKASLISYRSTALAFQPAFSSARLIAPAGAVVNHSGAWEKLAYATTRASGVAPAVRAADALISTRAAAPSAIEDELAAVTVPSLANAGLRLGILLISQLN